MRPSLKIHRALLLRRTSKRRTATFELLTLTCFVSSLALAAPPKKVPKTPGIEWFNPTGTVAVVKQAAARFTDDMVAFGDPRPTQPFDVDCPAKGSGRWIDNRNWVFDFEKDLPAGLRCAFTLKKDAKTLAGKAVTAARFTFSTGGPAIMENRPYEGSSGVEEDQAFVLKLNAEPNEKSVLEKVYFSVEGLPERVGVKWVGGSTREQVLKRSYWENVPSTIVLEAKQRFPSGAEVTLVWPKGVLSASGVPTDDEQTVKWVIRDAFNARFSCERENPDADCTPFSHFLVSLSSPAPMSVAKKFVLKDGTGKLYTPHIQDATSETISHLNYIGPFPASTEYTISIDGSVTDETGRELSNAKNFPVKFKTAEYPPLAKFAASFGILEAKGKPALPVTVRSLEPEVSARLLKFAEGSGILDRVKSYLSGAKAKKAIVAQGKVSEILFWMKRVDQARREKSVFDKKGKEAAPPVTKGIETLTLPGRSNPKAFEVIGIPMEKPGFYVVEIESDTLGKALLGSGKMYVPTAVLVTNMAVHFKWGRESSLAWVTSLDDGKPVGEADVQVRDCTGKVLATGKTDKTGVTRLASLPTARDTAWCGGEEDYSSLNRGLLVTAEKGDDMSFAHSTWDSGLEPWRFQLGEGDTVGSQLAHTVFARNLLRAGETLHMKHFVREHGTKGIFPQAEKNWPNTAILTHLGSDQSYRLPLKWDAAGTSESTWKIPKEAKLGSYTVTLAVTKARFDKKGNPTFDDSGHLTSGYFRVEEFRVPLMKAAILTPPEAIVAPSKVNVDLAVSYLNGGGASEKQVRFRTQVQPSSSVTFPDSPNYVFANGATKEGRKSSEDGEVGRETKKEVKSQDITLDKAGTARTTVSGLPALDTPYDVHTELQYSDPNGEVQTVSNDFRVHPAKLMVGLRFDSSDARQDAVKLYAKTVDLKGKALANQEISIDLFERKYFSHRKRIVGGFYAYQHEEEIKKLATFCRGKTDEKGILECEGKSPVSGNVVFQAMAKDADSRRSVANVQAWVSGDKEWWFAANNHDRMDILPDAKRYEPGQTAKFQVRSPFRSATALISVEREGVMDVYVREISGKRPIVEIPIKANYAPNVYVSVLAIRGRSGEVKPTALVDLGRPAFKLGLAEVKVGWKAHELAVTVKPERTVYRVRDKATVKVAVRTPDGKVPAPGAEIALAAVDEGLLELLPNHTWQLLEGMMGNRAYEVATATAQMQVIGKRHFGLKALPSGGGGGEGATRELFDTLLLWQARVKLDKKGEATVKIPLNDSLTSFRIVAIAHAGVERFGTGSASIRATQDLMMFSGIPPVVREGDKFRASFTLRNATEKPMQVALSGKYASNSLATQNVKLAGGESREAGWDVTVPHGVVSLGYEVEAREGSGAKDRIKITQKIATAVPVRTFQSTVVQLEKEHKLNVELPKDAVKGRGEMRVHVKPSLLAGAEGVKRYMSDYPYTCLEQQVSRAVVARDSKAWREVMAKLPSYLDGDGLAKYFPTSERGSDTLTSYVMAIAAAAGWEVPAASRERMGKALTGFVTGAIRVGSALQTADLSLRKLSAIEALSYYGKDGADPQLVSSIMIQPNLWPSSALIDWVSILNRSPKIAGRDGRLKDALGVLRARMTMQGTTLNFSTENSDRLWWLMTSPDVNAVRALSMVMDKAERKEDVPRLVRGAIARHRHGHWDLTTANAWGVLALEKYAAAFEKIPVAGITRAALAPNAETLNWKAEAKGKTLAFAWPAAMEGMVVTHDGPGKPWLVYEALAAIPLKEPLWAGYRIKKTIEPLEQKVKGKWSRGDLARVKLNLQSDNDMTWVVVSDPVPGGSSILGSGLGRDSSLATQGEKKEGWVWPVFEERSFEAFRSYYEWVPKGEWSTEYTVRLNNGGNFQLPVTRVEAMYSPEMFGELPNAAWEVAH